MDQLATLTFALGELRTAITGLDDKQMDTATNCEPWTARQLASHAVNSQLLWVGALTGDEIVSIKTTMGAVPYDGDLGPRVDDAIERAQAAWGADGVLDAAHRTPFGELPGAVAINFPIIDALAHSWDLRTSVGAVVEFSGDAIPAITAVIDAACNDGTRAMGLFGPVTATPADATETERLMAAAGRLINR